MMRLILLLVAVSVLALGFRLADRMDDTVQLDAVSTSAQDRLPSDFGTFVAGLHDRVPPTAPSTTTTTLEAKRRQTTQRLYHGHRCGGDLPPCWVMMRESGGDPTAYNPTGCSGRGCYGKWQCDPNTCDGTGSEEEQDAEARRVWDNGRGCQHWNAC